LKVIRGNDIVVNVDILNGWLLAKLITAGNPQVIKLKARRNARLYMLVIMLALSLMTLSPLLLSGCGKSPGSSTPSTTTSQTTAASTTTVDAPENLTVLSILGGAIQVAKKGSDDWKNGEEGMELEIGDEIKTGAGGKAMITFFDGSIIELENDTEISIVELGANADRTTTVKLKQEVGTTISRVKKLLDPGDSYEIETYSAAATVRGSMMYVRSIRLGPTFVGNIEGRVFVTAQGVEVELPQGTHTNVQPGEPPTPPEPGATPEVITTTTTGSTTTSSTPTSTSTLVTTSTSSSTTSTSTTTSSTTTSTTPTTSSTSSTTTSTSMTTTTTRPPLSAIITHPNDNDLIEMTQVITVSGVVNDTSITEANLTVNGVSSTIPVVNGQFDATVTLTMGIRNTITVSVSRDGETATAVINLDLEEQQVPR
jgi:hypothetical protein